MEHLQAYNRKLLANILPVHVAEHFMNMDKHTDVSLMRILKGVAILMMKGPDSIPVALCRLELIRSCPNPYDNWMVNDNELLII